MSIDERWPNIEPGPITDEGEMIKRQAMAERSLARLKKRLDLTCPTCKTPNALSLAEARKGYQCNRCADLEEGVGYCCREPSSTYQRGRGEFD